MPTNNELHGLPVTDMSADQKELARSVMRDVLAPFRKADVDESMKIIEAAGFDKLHFAYYSNMDVGNDGIWDVWQIEMSVNRLVFPWRSACAYMGSY